MRLTFSFKLQVGFGLHVEDSEWSKQILRKSHSFRFRIKRWNPIRCKIVIWFPPIGRKKYQGIVHNKIEPGSGKMWSRDMMQHKNPDYGKKLPTHSSIKVKLGHPIQCWMSHISHFLKIAHPVTSDIFRVWPWRKS